MNQSVKEILTSELSPQEIQVRTKQLSENVINQGQINQALLTRLLKLEGQLAGVQSEAATARQRWEGLAKRVEAVMASGGLGRQNSLYLGENLALARILGRFKMFVDTSDLVACAGLLGDGFLELGVTNWIPSVLREGMTFVDIGAGCGYFALVAAAAVGPQGRVEAIEADPRKQTILQRNINVNGLGRESGHCVRQHSLATLEVEAVAAAVPESFDLLRIAAGRAGLAILGHLLSRLQRNPRAKVLLEPGLAAESAATLPLLLRSLQSGGYTCSRILHNGQIERVMHLPANPESTLPVLLLERSSE